MLYNRKKGGSKMKDEKRERKRRKQRLKELEILYNAIEDKNVQYNLKISKEELNVLIWHYTGTEIIYERM